MNPLLKKLVKRLDPQNGLAVNAAVWQAAHNYHRFHQQAHLLWGHGPGIVTGLELYAEAGSRRVWVQPGLAVDPQGEIIILEAQDSQVIGPEQTGLIYIFLEGTGQSPLEAQAAGPAGKGPTWVRDGYVIESAARLPPTGVELGRIRLADDTATITDATHPNLPGRNELDLRFRPEVGARPRPAISAAICYLGATTEHSLPPYGLRAVALAQAWSRLTGYRVWLDDAVRPADLAAYRLVYLVEQSPHRPDEAIIDSLKAYLEGKKGVLLVESYLPSDVASPVEEMLTAIGPGFGPPPGPGHPLLEEPFMFAAPPPGAQPGRVRVGDGVIFCTVDYGRLWQQGAGQIQPAREQIRAALEWGSNIVVYSAKPRT